MKLVFDEMEETVLTNFYGGAQEMRARMLVDGNNKIMRGKLAPGATIGLHTHEANCEMVFILQGEGTMVYDDTVETLLPGDCHYCPRGHSHSLRNFGTEDLIFFAVVPKQ